MVSKGKQRGEILLGAFQVGGKLWERCICWLLFDVFKLFVFCFFFFFLFKVLFQSPEWYEWHSLYTSWCEFKIAIIANVRMWGEKSSSHGKEFENKPKAKVIEKVVWWFSCIGLTLKWFEVSKILKSNPVVSSIFFFFSFLFFFLLSSLFFWMIRKKETAQDYFLHAARCLAFFFPKEPNLS